MKVSDNKKVNDFLKDLESVSPDKLGIVDYIRGVFKSTAQEVEEDIKYGGVVYNKSGTLIGGIFPYKNYISIEFSSGSKMNEPEGVLERKEKK